MTLSAKEFNKLKKDLLSARNNAQMQKEKLKSSKSTQSKPFWKSILDFLTK
jgi:hypothetical protein